MLFSPIKFSTENVNYITPSWCDLNDLAFELSKKMILKKEKFDRIITLAKGGWPITRSIVDFLQVSQIATIGVKFYRDVDQRLKQPVIYQELPVKIENEKILLFDDVADTGESLNFVIKQLQQLKIASLKTATLFYKKRSIIKPDYFAAKTNSWIIFPYETVETINILSKTWQQQKIPKHEMKKRFLKLGFKEDIVDFYTSAKK